MDKINFKIIPTDFTIVKNMRKLLVLQEKLGIKNMQEASVLQQFDFGIETICSFAEYDKEKYTEEDFKEYIVNKTEKEVTDLVLKLTGGHDILNIGNDEKKTN